MRFLASAAFAASMISASAGAEVREYNSSLFAGLQARDEPIVLLIADGSCDQCAAADSSVRQIASTRGFEHVHVLRIDPAAQKSLARAYDAQTQPKIIGFHGFNETGRVGEVADSAKILKLFDSTLP